MSTDISTRALKEISNLLYVNIQEPLTVDYLTIDKVFDEEYDIDRKVLAPNPENDNIWEVGVLGEFSKVGTVRVGFSHTTSVIDYWNVKPFLYIQPYADLLDGLQRHEAVAYEWITTVKPNFLKRMTATTSTNEILKMAIDRDYGISPTEARKIVKLMDSKDEESEHRIVALTAVYAGLLEFLLPEQLKSEVERVQTKYSDESILFQSEYKDYLRENETHPETLLVYVNVKNLDFETKESAAHSVFPMFSQGEAILSGEIVTDLFYNEHIGWVYITPNIEGTILPLIMESAPLLQNSVYRWWKPYKAGDTVAHYRELDLPGRTVNYGTVSHVMDEVGHIDVAWELRDMPVPQHLYRKINVGADDNMRLGTSVNMTLNRTILDYYLIEINDKKTAWRLQSMHGDEYTLYRGPFSAVVQTTMDRSDMEPAVTKTKDEPFYRGYPVLLQTHPEFVSARFLVLGSRYSESWKALEYCCKPIGFPDDNRGAVWLPEGSIYSVTMWYMEAGRPDPLPLPITIPRPPLVLQKDFSIENYTHSVYDTAGETIVAKPQRNTDPAVIGAGIIALYIMIDDS